MSGGGVNGARGEVLCRLGGVKRRLCLTLGSLAEIETALGAAGEVLAERLGRLSAAELKAVLAALLRAGGECAAAAELVAETAKRIEAEAAVTSAFSAALG